METEIGVTVLCTTYNHRNYIRSALEGFVSQQTNFKFEVLAHDDASTDGTADIVREYERKYPDLIKGIYQTENQYSKGVRISSTILVPLARGKYIAYCEGDDYWIDPLKLQKQYDQLEKHPEIDICAHSALVSRDGKVIGLSSPKESDCVIPPGEVILGGGAFVATASLMRRSKNILKEPREPEYQRMTGLDYLIQINGSVPGGMLFLKDYMSVYRVWTPGGWSARTDVYSVEFGEYLSRMDMALSCLNQKTNFAYDDEFKRCLRIDECRILLARGEHKRIKNEYPDVYSRFDTRLRTWISVSVISPQLGKLVRWFDKKLALLLGRPKRIFQEMKYKKYQSLLKEQ